MTSVVETIETMADLKYAVLCQLKRGRANALTAHLLAQRLGFNDHRQIRQAIRKLIAERIPIAASEAPPSGYFIAETKVEVNRYLSTLKGRLIEDAYRRRDFKLAAKHILQPEQLFLHIGGKDESL